MAAALRIRKSSAADQVCEQIRGLVLDGTWPVDSKIPAESQLAASFGVNRLTVRVALQRLNTLGILETRDGEGTFVRSFDFKAHMARISDFYMSPGLISGIGEFRSIIETECARLAVERTEEKDLGRLREACQAFEDEMKAYDGLKSDEAREAAFSRTIDETLAIHTELCRLSGNPLLAMSFEVAEEPIRRYMRTIARNRPLDRDADGRNHWVKAHWEIYEALRAKDFPRLKAAILHIVRGRATDGAGKA